MTKNNYFIFACSFFLTLALLHINKYAYISDDLWFSATSNAESDHIKWVISRYHNWSSRTPIEYLLISLINHYNIWSVLNAVFFSLFMVSACSINSGFGNKSEKFIPAIFTIFLIYNIPKDTFFDGAIWVTGSFNYLWPTALAFLGYSLLISIISKNSQSRTLTYTCVLLFIFSSFNEQIAITNLIIVSSMVFYCKSANKSLTPPLLMMVATVLVLVYIITCPGNSARYDSEITRWFKSYSHFSFIQKSLLGLNLYADILLAKKSLVPSIAAFSISLVCKKRLKFFPIIAGCILLIVAGIYSSPETLLQARLTEETIYSALSFRRVFYAFAITSMIFFPLIFSCKLKLISFVLSGMLLSAVASTSMLGFSPTVYASGERVLFISYFFFTMISVVAYISFINRINNEAEDKYRICSFL